MTLKSQIDRFSQNETNFNALITGSAGTTVDLGDAGIVKSVATVISEIAPGVDRGSWATTTAYIINDIVLESGAYYRCRENHTSGTFATDLTAGKWRLNQGGDSTILTHRGRTLDDAITARFDDVTQMIADVNLAVGDVVETFANQNGAAINQKWDIVAAATGVDNGGDYIDLTGSGLQAKQVFGLHILLENFGGFSGDSTTALQSAIDYTQSIECPLYTNLQSFTLSAPITYPSNWVNIQLYSTRRGNAYVGSEGCAVNCTSGALVIPLDSGNHQSIDIKGFTFVRSGASRSDSAITIAIDGTRTYNYPIRWNFDLSFRRWDVCYDFVRTGGNIDPDGFIGTMMHDNANPYDCNAFMKLTGTYLNLCTLRNGRFHGLAELIRVGSGSGAFIDFEDCHFEGINDGGDTSKGIITIDSLALESRFSFHNHDWENCGQLFRVDSNQSRLFDVTFTGKNRFNSYLIEDQEFKFLNVANYSVDSMTIISNQSVIRTPNTIKLKTRSSTDFTSSRITLAYVPVSAYRAGGINYVSDPIAGVRQFGATAIGGYMDGSFEWIRPTNSAAFFSSNQALTKNHNISGDDVYVITSIIDLVSQSTKVGNPVSTIIDGNSIQYFPSSFIGESGLYYCILMIKTGSASNITDFSSTVVAKGAGGLSIGYGKYITDTATPVVDMLPKVGGSLLVTRSVAATANVAIPIRSATNAQISSKINISDNDGGIYYEVANRGKANTGLKVRTVIVNSVDTAKVVSVADGDAPDLAKLTLTNNSASTVIFSVNITFN